MKKPATKRYNKYCVSVPANAKTEYCAWILINYIQTYFKM